MHYSYFQCLLTVSQTIGDKTSDMVSYKTHLNQNRCSFQIVEREAENGKMEMFEIEVNEKGMIYIIYNMLLVWSEICKVHEPVSVHNSQKNQRKLQKDKNKPT